MKLTQHPEYHTVYIHNQEAAQRCQEATATWKVSHEAINVPGYALEWTYASAQEFVRSLSRLFQEYNRVLWNRFHYCRECGGQCCVVDASDVRAFDLLAVALLDRSTPSLPDNITARERECIYLSNRQCSWPGEWRTIKCWSFYCLGVGPWKSGASVGELYSAITVELQQVVRNLLPDQLRKYEAVHEVSLANYLDDPVRFSDELQKALGEIFVAPFNQYYPLIDGQEASSRKNGTRMQKESKLVSLMLDDDASTFIAEAVEQVYECPPTVPEKLEISAEQLLEDLELLQWIIEGHPSHEVRLLQEMYRRYADAPAPREGDEPTIWYRMRDYIFKISQ